ncbi:MAG: YkgJ family cysteine cluster protein [Deltaproteobacteria bacterium]|nr:YkgJ family cysteine cluster protein [Deltaproteobacteria bacterium]
MSPARSPSRSRLSGKHHKGWVFLFNKVECKGASDSQSQGIHKRGNDKTMGQETPCNVFIPECKACCCRPRVVFTNTDIEVLARHFAMNEDQVKELYLEYHPDHIYHAKRKKRYCFFLTDDYQCGIHEVKPQVCKMYRCLRLTGFWESTRGVK